MNGPSPAAGTVDPSKVWLDKPEQWERLADALVRAGEFGIDTETYGQPDRTSPQHRARVHVWSVGVLTARQNPRGYRQASGFVLPVAALSHPAIVGVLGEARIRKWAHNAPHDFHALTNHGLLVAGMGDTLQWARVAAPGLGDYGLKGMEQWALGKPPRPSFIDIVSHETEVVRITYRKEKRCICGKVPCRARSASEWWDQQLGWFRPHTREVVSLPTEHRRMVTVRWDVTDFVPGHERWAEWLAYSLADAVSGIEIVDWLRRRRTRQYRYPWQRPSSSASAAKPLTV